MLCNCDDPFESNFFKYFALNFNHLGLKKLVATCYSGSPIAGGEYQPSLFDDDVDETPDATAGRTRPSSTSSATQPATAAWTWTTSGTCWTPGRTN